MKQQFPCGPKASCCGPIGQSEEEITVLKNAIEKLEFDIEVCDLQKMKNLHENQQIFKLISNYGPRVTPVITIGDEVVSMGQTEINEIILAIKSKL
jgi:disulfide oxidoreductase YuzD